MKINNSIKSPANIASEQKARSGHEAKALPNDSGSKVELSSLAGRMQQLEQVIAQTPVVDASKVDEIKQAIAQGQFKVNPEKVADGLIESVRQMLAAQPNVA